ncbi:MAG: MBL fold metallo-hydrolase [Patescibacteria group bacterium]
MQLSFHGAVEEVTGSCFLLETSKAKILVDAGMKQGERMCMLKSLEPFQFDVKSLDAVVVTHAHFDHTGRLPELIKLGYTGPIYMTAPTKALTDIILEDSLKIMTENAERCGDPVPFGPEDKAAAIAQIRGIGYHTEIEAAPGVRVMFHDAGHILGSAYVSIDVEERQGADGKPFRLIFSGDIGNDNIPILSETEPINHADVVVCESTYGNSVHEPAAMRGKMLVEFAHKVLGRGGSLIIPAFSIERTQELLYELDQLLMAKKIPSVPIYLDSPMAIRATAVYRHFEQYLKFDSKVLGPDKDFFSFPNLKETMSTEASKLINEDKRAKIIIAGNGMMTGGRVMHHLKHLISDPLSGILVVGYQARGTLGRRILDREKTVRIHKRDFQVRAELMDIKAFSAHGDKEKLLRWLHPLNGSVQKIFLVHGDDPVKQDFAEFLGKNLSAEIVIPSLFQSFEL